MILTVILSVASGLVGGLALAGLVIVFTRSMAGRKGTIFARIGRKG